MFRIVSTLSGTPRHHRIRRAFAYTVGLLVLLAGYAALLPVMFFVGAFAIFGLAGDGLSFEGVEASTVLVLVGCLLASVVLWRLGLRLIRGHRNLVLFLRKFGFSSATEALSIAVGSGVGRRWRLVTLDDHDVAPMGVGGRARWTVRIVRFLFVAVAIAATLAAVRAISGDAFQNIADQAHDDALRQAAEEGKSTLEAEIGAIFVGALVAGLTLLILTVVWSTLIALAATASMMMSAASRSVRRAEHAKAVLVSRAGDVDRVADRLVRGTKKVLAPRIVVARVADPLWQVFVRRMATVSDLVLVDVSRPTENLVWEVHALERDRVRWLPIGEVEKLHALGVDPAPAAEELRRLLSEREVLAYDPRSLQTFAHGLRHSLAVVGR